MRCQIGVLHPKQLPPASDLHPAPAPPPYLCVQLTPVDAFGAVFNTSVCMAAVVGHEVAINTLAAAAARLVEQYPPLAGRCGQTGIGLGES